MKTKNISKIFILSAMTMGLASCNDYLDKLPDDRAEVNTVEKVTSLLLSAYPGSSYNVLMEMSSDNVMDNGKQYGSSTMIEEMYKWEDVRTDGNDSPKQVWNGYYEAVAVANQALQSIKEMGNPEELKAQTAEAKMCRAYSMFQLASCFCMAWNPEKSDEYQGLPYPTEPEKNIFTTYERGNLTQLYANIYKDITEAIDDIDDNIYTQKTYHFNKKAAHAFAARFCLYYMKYEEAIKHANYVLGQDPTAVMRNYAKYNDLGRDDYGNLWVRSSEACNLLLITAYSSAGAIQWGAYTRFGHNSPIASYETFWPKGLWGEGSSYNCLYYAHKLYGNNQCVSFPKLELKFECTDKTAGIGYYRIVDPVFTGDETVLVRAEAYALLHKFDESLKDVNTWIKTHCNPNYFYAEENGDSTFVEVPTATLESVKELYDAIDYAPDTISYNGERKIKKTLHPQGFKIDEGTWDVDKKGNPKYFPSDQENMLQLILHMRRLETIFQGMRFYDIKRYGISFSHNVSGQEAIYFKPGDLRGAIQLPQDVIGAGLPANVRAASN